MTKVYKLPANSYKELKLDRDRIRSAIDLIDELILLDALVRKDSTDSLLGPNANCFMTVRTGLHQMELDRNSKIANLVKG